MASTRPLVLLIDDNEDNRALFHHMLGPADVTVAEAASAEEGLRSAADLHPALILLDLSMPGLDGWEVARRLRASPETARTPIVALSAHTTGEARERALRAGCNDYLPKPTLPADLLAVVNRLVPRDFR
jgi:CheY-like chemotaxis protein